MRALRVVLVVMGITLLTRTAARPVKSASTRRGADYRSLATVEKVEWLDGGESAQSTAIKERGTTGGEQILEIFPRDVQKRKFLKHLTGPLHFSPKCRKHVYRLYHNTRDCTMPAYYKRCARLLTRLAESPRCLQS